MLVVDIDEILFPDPPSYPRFTIVNGLDAWVELTHPNACTIPFAMYHSHSARNISLDPRYTLASRFPTRGTSAAGLWSKSIVVLHRAKFAWLHWGYCMDGKDDTEAVGMRGYDERPPQNVPRIRSIHYWSLFVHRRHERKDNTVIKNEYVEFYDKFVKNELERRCQENGICQTKLEVQNYSDFNTTTWLPYVPV